MRNLWVLGLVLAMGGCAETPPVDATVQVLTFKRHPGEAVDQSGVAIAAEAITPDNLAQHQGLMAKLSWQEVDRNAPSAGGENFSGSGAMITRYQMVALIPMPTFEIRIANHSDKPLKFDKAKIAVVDSTGKRFAAFADGGAIAGRVESDITDLYSGLAQKQDSMAYVRDAVSKLPWLSSALVVAPGSEWQGLIAVDLGVHDLAELDHYLQKVDKLTLELAGVDGGAAPITFDVAFDRAKIGMAMSCPQGKPPSVDLCKPKS